MTTTEEPGGGGTVTVIDKSYEFYAPRFFDFMIDESDEDTRSAELWFESAISYAPSHPTHFAEAEKNQEWCNAMKQKFLAIQKNYLKDCDTSEQAFSEQLGVNLKEQLGV